MNRPPTRPEDVIPDGEDFKTIRGIRVRKGTIAAAMGNMELLESGTEPEKQAAMEALRTLAPALVVLGVHRHFLCRNPDVEQLLAAVATELDDR